MPNYVLAYHGGNMPENPEEHKAKCKAWIRDLGNAVINPGTPMGISKTVSSSDVSDDGGLLGFSIVKAESMEAAIEITKGCPHLEIGTVEVAEEKEA